MPIHVSETMPGDELIVTTKNETLACKVVAVTQRQEPQFCCEKFAHYAERGVLNTGGSGSWCLPMDGCQQIISYCPFCAAIL